MGSPGCALGHNFIRVSAQLLQQWLKAPLPAVAHCDYRVPPQTSALGAAHGRSAESFPELLGCHLGQPFQCWVDQSFSSLEFLRARCRRFAIPRADILADVAAEHMTAHPVAHVFRNRSALFDGEI